MKTAMKIVLGVAILLVIVGVIGGLASDNPFPNIFGENNYSTRGGMMQNSYFSNNDNTGEKMELEALEARVESYIGQFKEHLVIGGIFIFEDSDYYFMVLEEDTGLGAMELLANPYTGDVYPEFGPNMMWNLKYGMHNNSGYGMMGSRGIMGRGSFRGYFTNQDSYAESNTVPLTEAQGLASEYVKDNISKGYTVSKEGHEFYGYYTFHTEDGNKTVGMLSVNGFSGDVWYHDWHGTTIEVIDGHDDDDH